jgi:hypothetical protein
LADVFGLDMASSIELEKPAKRVATKRASLKAAKGKRSRRKPSKK